MNALPKTKTEIKTSHLRLVSNTRESQKVSVDDGFTAIPNELLFALSRFQFTQRQYSVLLAVIQKTLSWHKETDWICNDQIAELANLYDSKLASKIKNELIEMNVLIQKGKQIGVNLAISEWGNSDSTKDTKIARNVRNKSDKSYDSNRTNHTTTKETITKQKINNTPLPPTGKSADADGQAVSSGENSAKSKNLPVDYLGVLEEFNAAVGDTPISQIRVMSDQRKRAVHSLAKLIRREFGCYTRQAFGDYFRDFVAQANARRDRFYFGGVDGSAWKADFDYLLRAKTFAKTVENSL